MELSISLQGLQALASLACGPALGLLYDMLAELRKRFKLERLIFMFDVLFCLVFACVLFLLGSVVGMGKLRLFMLPAIVLGGAVYFLLLRRFGQALCALLAAALSHVLRLLSFPVKFLAFTVKKIGKITKNLFHYLRLWFKIQDKAFSADESKDNSGGDNSEIKAGRYSYEVNIDRSVDLRTGVSDKYAKTHRRSREFP